MPRKYEPVAKCPEILKEMLEVVNLLPDNAEQLFDEIIETRTFYKNETGTIIRDTAKEILNEKIVDFCFDREPKNEEFERLKDLIKAKVIFRHFAKLNKRFPNWKEVQKDEGEIRRFSLNFFTIDFENREFSVSLSFNSKGIIKPRKSEFLDMFEDFDIPIYRIRECPICLKIFWAKKLNSETCGKKKCADDLGNKKRLDEANKLKEKHKNHFKSRVEK